MNSLFPDHHSINACQKQASVDGINLSYSDTGKEGSAILFIQGNSLSRQSFSGQFYDPLLNRYRLIALDLPGHGHSSKAALEEGVYSLEYYAQIVRELITLLGLNSFILCGHSLGGHIAAYAVASQLNGLRGLYLFGMAPIREIAELPQSMPQVEPNAAFFRATLDPEMCDRMSRAVARFAETSTQKMISRAIASSDPLARERLSESIGAIGVIDEIDVLQKTAVPVGIACGEEDSFVCPRFLRALEMDNLWRGAPQWIELASHAPQLENTKAFNASLLSFAEEAF